MKTALIIIDIQNDYFEYGKMALSGAEQASENARLVLEDFRLKKMPVVHIQHLSNRPQATFFLPDTEGVKIHKSVLPLPNEKVIMKHYPNSFRETELLQYLQEKGIEKLVICGMMTHMCVDATTRSAKDFGFECTIIGDGCATKDLEVSNEKVEAPAVQKSFLAALNYYYASVTTTEAYLESSK